MLVSIPLLILAVGFGVVCLVEPLLFPTFGTAAFLSFTLKAAAGSSVTIGLARLGIGLDEATR